MFELLKNWYQRRFSDPQAIGLLVILFFGFILLYFFSNLIMPLLIAIVLAYFLEWPVNFLNRCLNIPHILSLLFVLTIFISIMVFLGLVLIPALWNQLTNLMQDLPSMINQFHTWLLSLPEDYPEIVDYSMIDTIYSTLRDKTLLVGETMLKYSISSLLNLVELGIYAFLVPLMVFFLIKDRDELIAVATQFLPQNRHLATRVWQEMKQQIANYIRGKFIEIMVVTMVTYAIFLFFGLNYSLLLAVAVGVSVLVPYVGAVLVTMPIALVGVFQFGFEPTFWSLMTTFVISQLLDGNLLVPLLFSEAVNLHPLIIIIAVIIFGGLWGFWGVFFAIPLATLIKAVFSSWPNQEMIQASQKRESNN